LKLTQNNWTRKTAGNADKKVPARSVTLLGWFSLAREVASIPRGNIDAIVGQHVIEHLSDPHAALTEWHRLLRPFGRLALATPNAKYPDPAHFADSDHAHIFSTQDLRSVVERAGFIVEYCSTLFPYLTRARILRAVSVFGYKLFLRMPYYAERGRTIILAATKA
jgi:SAM-dependent methyltransferase